MYEQKYTKRLPCLSAFKIYPSLCQISMANSKIVDKVLSQFLKPTAKGRRGYDKAWMFKWLIYKQITGCRYRDLESMTGVDYTTFIKFKQRLSVQEWFKNIFNELISKLTPKIKDFNLIIDSSFVQTYSKHDEQGSEYFGYKQKNGFKLHQMIDYKTRLPVLQYTTPGARADVIWGLKLIRAAPKDWNVKGILADKGYDADELVMTAKNKWKGIKVGIQVRQTSHLKVTGKPESLINRKAKEASRYLKQSFLNKRTEIERYFSRKKRVFNLGEERTRHLKNFRNNCYLTSIMEILEWMSKDSLFRYYSPSSGNIAAPIYFADLSFFEQ